MSTVGDSVFCFSNKFTGEVQTLFFWSIALPWFGWLRALDRLPLGGLGI